MDPISSSSSLKRPVEDAASKASGPGALPQLRVSARAGQGIDGLSARSQVSSSATATATATSSSSARTDPTAPTASIFKAEEQQMLKDSNKVLLLHYSSTGGGHTERCLLPVLEAFEAGTLKKGDCVVILAPPRWKHDDKGNQVGKLHDFVEQLRGKDLHVLLKQSDKTFTGLYERGGPSASVEMMLEFVLAPRRPDRVSSSIVRPSKEEPWPEVEASLAKDIVDAVIDAVGLQSLSKLSSLADMGSPLQKAATSRGIERRVEIGNHQGLFIGVGRASLGDKSLAYLAKASSSGQASHVALVEYDATTNVVPTLGVTLKLLGINEATTKEAARNMALAHLLKHAVVNDLAGGEFKNGIIKAEGLQAAGGVKALVYLYVNAYTQGMVDHIRSQINNNAPGYDKALFAVCGNEAFHTVPSGQPVKNILHAMHAGHADGITSGGFGTTSEYNFLREAGDYKGDLIVAPVERQDEQNSNGAVLLDRSDGRVTQASGINAMAAELDALVLRRATEAPHLSGDMSMMFECSSAAGSHARHAADLLAGTAEMKPNARAAMEAMARYEAEYAPKELRRIDKLYVPALLAIICGETKVDVLATKKAGPVQFLEITDAIIRMRDAAKLGGDAALKDLLKIDIKNVRAKSLISGLADKLETMTLLPEVERPNAAWCALNDYAVERQAMGW